MQRILSIGVLLLTCQLAWCVQFAPVVRAEDPTEISRAAIETADEAEIVELIEQLGDGVYVRREAASARLIDIGMPAEPWLRKARESADAEVRNRAIRILAVIIEADFNKRLRAFAADVDDQKKLSLPGWDRFRERVGTDANARSLFVMIQRSEAPLMEIYQDDPKQAAQAFDERCQALQRMMNNRFGGQVYEVELGSVSALLFLATDGQVPISETVSSQLYSFLYRTAFRNGMNHNGFRPYLRKLLAQWITQGKVENAANGYHRVVLAMRYEIEEGIGPAVAMLKQQGAPVYYRVYSLLAIGKLGSQEHLPTIEPLLADDSLFTKRKINKQELTIQMRDVALAVMVHLSGQEAKEYGFKHLQQQGEFLFNPQSVYFDSDKDRQAALAKWKKWAGEAKKG